MKLLIRMTTMNGDKRKSIIKKMSLFKLIEQKSILYRERGERKAESSFINFNAFLCSKRINKKKNCSIFLRKVGGHSNEISSVK